MGLGVLNLGQYNRHKELSFLAVTKEMKETFKCVKFRRGMGEELQTPHSGVRYTGLTV